MCYNAPVSITTFAIGIYIAYEIWTRRQDTVYKKSYDYWNVLFIISFMLVQLGEGFMWLGYDLARYLIIFSVAMQPVVQSFGNAYYNNQPAFYLPVLLGIIFLFFVNAPANISKGPNGHLNWQLLFKSQWSQVLFIIYYFSFMILPLFWQVPLKRYSILAIYGAITLVWSVYNYSKSGEFSSMWCFLGIGYAFLAYFVNKRDGPKENQPGRSP